MIANRTNTDFVPASQLILNEDNSLYHLGLKDEHIADTVIIVGDPDRVEMISNRFDSVEFKIEQREFKTHTGALRGKKLTVISTGIGVDNIDIVINELDAAVNVDPKTRKPKSKLRSLRLIRLGTCGALRKDIPLGTPIASAFAIGMDGVPWHYDMKMTPEEEVVANAFVAHTKWRSTLADPYCAKADKLMLNNIGAGMIHGITVTANGFYGPQGRSVRLKTSDSEWLEKLSNFEVNDVQASNFEMESAGIYALGSALGHRVLTCAVALANRQGEVFTKDPQKAVEGLIDLVLSRL